MTNATAAFYGVPTFDGRILPADFGRRVLNTIAMAAGAVGLVGVLAVTVTVAAAWIISTTLSTSPHLHARTPMGPGGLALVRVDRVAGQSASLTQSAPAPVQVSIGSGDPSAVSSASKWAGAIAFAPSPVARAAKPHIERTGPVPLPRPHPAQMQIARVIETAPQTTSSIAPLPEPKAAPKPMPQVAIAMPPPPAPAEKRALPQLAHNKSLALPDPGSRTAIYDISARTVFMPNGQKLEAHSGLGEKLDDPRYVKVRMRGPTPPNVYDLTLREQLFHGVRAIRLNPLDEGKMHGRDGMLAHTYMLGPNGQSNGCVSFKDYQKFLNAFLNGEVDRLVVVPDRSDTSWRSIVAQYGPARRQPTRRYASNSEPADDSPVERSFTTW
jgi:hypothetical protein